MKLSRNTIITLCSLASCGLRGVEAESGVVAQAMDVKHVRTAEEATRSLQRGQYEIDKQSFIFEEVSPVMMCKNENFYPGILLRMSFEINGVKQSIDEQGDDKMNYKFRIDGIDGLITRQQLIDLVSTGCGSFDNSEDRAFTITLGDKDVYVKTCFEIETGKIVDRKRRFTTLKDFLSLVVSIDPAA